MIALGIRYLTRRCVALNANKTVVEWPPHPGRVFMALTAAHFDSPAPAPDERDALCWLERQPSPSISETAGEGQRAGVEGYVPANDATGGVVTRPRSPRRFTSKYVGDAPVVMRWAADPPPEIRHALQGLCARVTRIGHSSSPVQMWITDSGGEPNWRPVKFSPDARSLRVPTRGALKALERAFAEEERPRFSSWQAYSSSRPPADREITGPFNPDLIVFSSDTEGSTRLGLASTLQATSALRNAAMALSSLQPPPEWLSGHTPSGSPSADPHCAFFPLPHVGAEHADGHLLGLAMAIPAGLGDEQLRPVLGPLLFNDDGSERELSLWCKAWCWTVHRESSALPPLNLRAATWTGPSTKWASVTPVVLHHHPKRNRSGDVVRIVREAFASAGLPQPGEIATRPASALRGAGHARELPPYDEGGSDMCRYQVHVVASFAAPVTGPVLVGRGRFRGYGLFRPIGAGGEA